MSKAAEAKLHMMDEGQWEQVGELFDRLLAGGDPQDILASELDPSIREAALQLWRHHVSADQENYLSDPLEFEVMPIFRPGQRLLNRFLIEKLLGKAADG